MPKMIDFHIIFCTTANKVTGVRSAYLFFIFYFYAKISAFPVPREFRAENRKNPVISRFRGSSAGNIKSSAAINAGSGTKMPVFFAALQRETFTATRDFGDFVTLCNARKRARRYVRRKTKRQPFFRKMAVL
ncbi:hypothetical protein [Paenibacillus naphthalenovorans]|uniref:hypothetical protein n=1 Tax=Paenibacillus naphthalenovorans TaxID=162209 RepID=UPI003D2D59F3